MVMAATLAGTQALYTWNLATPRAPLFDPCQRFNGQIIPPRRRNQHSTNNFEEDLNNDYRWLIKSTRVVASPPAGHFQCWIPQGPGIQPTASGYNRFSFRGVYYMCHVYVWHYHHPNSKASAQDISHLCSNEACCRPSHLHRESRHHNISRRGCLGYLVSTESPDMIIMACAHNPPCAKTASFSEKSNAVTLNYEQ